MKPGIVRNIAIFTLGLLLLCVLLTVLASWQRSLWALAAYAIPSMLLLWWLLMAIGASDAIGSAYPSPGVFIRVGRKTGNVWMQTGGWAGVAGPVLLCAALFWDLYA